MEKLYIKAPCALYKKLLLLLLILFYITDSHSNVEECSTKLWQVYCMWAHSVHGIWFLWLDRTGTLPPQGTFKDVKSGKENVALMKIISFEGTQVVHSAQPASLLMDDTHVYPKGL